MFEEEIILIMQQNTVPDQEIYPGIPVFTALFLAAGTIIGFLLIAAVFFFRVPEEKTNEVLDTLALEGYHPRETLRTGESTF